MLRRRGLAAEAAASQTTPTSTGLPATTAALLLAQVISSLPTTLKTPPSLSAAAAAQCPSRTKSSPFSSSATAAVLSSLSAASTLATAVFVTAAAAVATLSSAPFTAHAHRQQRFCLSACSILTATTYVSRQRARCPLAVQLKWAKDKRVPASAAIPSGGRRGKNTSGTTYPPFEHVVTHKAARAAAGVAAASRDVAAKRFSCLICVAGRRCFSLRRVGTPAGATLPETSAAGRFWALPRARPNIVVGNAPQHSSRAFFNSSFVSNAEVHFISSCVRNCVLPSLGPKQSLGRSRGFCSAYNERSHCEEVSTQRCLRSTESPVSLTSSFSYSRPVVNVVSRLRLEPPKQHSNGRGHFLLVFVDLPKVLKLSANAFPPTDSAETLVPAQRVACDKRHSRGNICYSNTDKDLKEQRRSRCLRSRGGSPLFRRLKVHSTRRGGAADQTNTSCLTHVADNECGHPSSSALYRSSCCADSLITRRIGSRIGCGRTVCSSSSRSRPYCVNRSSTARWAAHSINGSNSSGAHRKNLGQVIVACSQLRAHLRLSTTPVLVSFAVELAGRANSSFNSVNSPGNLAKLRHNRQLFVSTVRLSPFTMKLAAAGGEEPAGPDGVMLQPEPQEQELFDMLLCCVKDERLNIVGGWVRDKLLHRRSDDIDIAIDKMTGTQFAGALNRWRIARGLPSHAVGVIASNPEQSKHLETATCRLGRFHVDFVHLRTETYSEGSRIPEAVAYGSPEEDATRRDFTINALFYNLHTRQIEDFTGSGLQDLRDGLLRAPLPNAESTLLDDPLRTLRAVRFASRFGFHLHSDFVRAARLANVQEALLAKVSRERIGVELKKMLTGPSVSKEVFSPHDESRTQNALQAKAPEELLLKISPTALNIKQTMSHERHSMRAPTSGISDETSAMRTKKKEADDNSGSQGMCTETDPAMCPTTDVRVEDETLYKLLSAAARSAREALRLFVCLSIVRCVFKLPKDVLALPTCANASFASDPLPQDLQRLISCEHDSRLKQWWDHGLRCACALTTSLEHYFEGLVEGNVSQEHNDTSNKENFATDMEFNEFMKQADLCVPENFTGSYFAVLVLASFLLPMAGRFCLNGKSKPEKLLNVVVVESLKLSRKDADQIVILAEGACAFLQEISNITALQKKGSKPPTENNSEVANYPELSDDCTWQSNERVRLGLLIRNVGPAWRRALLIAGAALQTDGGGFQTEREGVGKNLFDINTTKGDTVNDIDSGETVPDCKGQRSLKRARPHNSDDADKNDFPKDKDTRIAPVTNQATEKACILLRKHKLASILLIQQKIKQQKVAEAWKLQPLYDGRAVKEVLPNLPKGPIFKKVLDEQVRWQLANPSKSRQDCALHLQAMFGEFS